MIREVEGFPSPLTYSPLTTAVEVRWLEPSRPGGTISESRTPLLEVHVIPDGAQQLSARLLEQLEERLPRQVRASGLASITDALELHHESGEVSLRLPGDNGPRGWREVHAGSLHVVRADQSGRIGMGFHLPGDSMGSILDSSDVVASVLDRVETGRSAGPHRRRPVRDCNWLVFTNKRCGWSDHGSWANQRKYGRGQRTSPYRPRRTREPSSARPWCAGSCGRTYAIAPSRVFHPPVKPPHQLHSPSSSPHNWPVAQARLTASNA